MERVRRRLITHKGKISYSFLIIFLIVVGVLVVGFFGDQIPFLKNKNQVLAPSPVPGNKQNLLKYSNSKFGFQFEFPATWEIGEIEAKNEKIFHSILQITPMGFKGDIPPIKLLYVANPNKLSIAALENTLTPKTGLPVLYSPDDTYTLSGAGLPAYFREEGNCVTTKCQIYTFSKDDKVYQLANFTNQNNPDQQKIFNQVFNSLSFEETPTTSSTSGNSKLNVAPPGH